MALCPFAVQKPIDTNHGGAMSAHLGLVIHVQQGNGSLAGFFNNPAAQVSATFWCAKDGTLEQYLDTDVVAWAEMNGNGTYDSCEFEGFDTEPMTPAQLATGAKLAGWLAGVYGWPIVGPVAHGSKGVTPHCNPDGTPDPSWGDHPCPGAIRLAQIPTLVALAKGQPTPTPPAPPTPQGDAMQSQVFSFKANQLDIVEVSQGALWHKYNQGSGWKNEAIGVAGVTYVGQPQVAIIGGAAWVSVEDASGRLWTFLQTATGSTWSNAKLP